MGKGKRQYTPLRNGNYMSYAGTPPTYDLPTSAKIAIACQRDKFMEIMKNEPIIECENIFTHDHRLKGVICKVQSFIEGRLYPLTTFTLQELPGCCGILVSCYAEVYNSFRGRGLGKLFLQVRQQIAQLSGYTILQATVVADNTKELKILEKAGWKIIDEFVNRRTRNNIIVLTKHLD